MILIRDSKTFSNLENRKLTTLSNLEGKSILNGDFQNTIENFYADQMPLGETLKEYYNIFKNITGSSLLVTLYQKSDSNTLIPLANGIYRLNKSDYLVYEPIKFEDIRKDLDKYLININKIYDKYNIPTYVFYLNKDIDINHYQEISHYMQSNLNKKIKFDYFKVLNNDDNDYYGKYKKYFYKTDHHWNYQGSYEGYKIIAHLMQKESLSYQEEVCFNSLKFIGTKGKKVGDFFNYDNFCSYKFNLLEYDTYINKELKTYGNMESYYKGNYFHEKGINHYAKFYGDDYGEVIYNFHNNKENLLIFSNSYSNAVNELIASSFNKTYIIDLRAYEEDLDKEYNLDSYIKENDIEKILFLGDINFYSSDVFLINNY